MKANNSDAFLKKFGENLSRIRKENGLPQSEMELYGISRAYYGRIELGEHSISLDKINLIAQAFGVPVYMLFIDKNGYPI